MTGTTPAIGQSSQFTATAQTSDGSSQTVTDTATWFSSATSIATVSSTGSVTSIAAGSADISATYRNVAGLLHITVAPVSNPTPLACGVERWPVKTLSDAGANRVDFNNVITTTITALNQLPAHCSGLPDARTFAEEFHVYEVSGVVQVTRIEDDHDVHIALADPNNAAQTIVVEVVDPVCATTSAYASILSQARSSYVGLGGLVGKTVTVRGAGFYDFAHGQTGRSTSCIELHPVVSIR